MRRMVSSVVLEWAVQKGLRVAPGMVQWLVLKRAHGTEFVHLIHTIMVDGRGKPGNTFVR